MNLYKLISAIFIIASVISCGIYDQFPSQEEISLIIKKYDTAKDQREKVDILREMVVSINNPRNKEQDGIVESTLAKLAEIYEATNDVAILEATDGVKMDGGFANYMCEFYKKLSKTEGFSEYYFVNNDGGNLKKCIGISFSRDEFQKLNNK